MVTCTPSCFSPAAKACWSNTSLRKGRSFTLSLARKGILPVIARQLGATQGESS